MRQEDKRVLYRPQMTSVGRAPTYQVVAVDEYGIEDVWVPGEAPLTLKVDGKEIVTLMTLGTHPAELALGYLRNQRLIEEVEEIASVNVDWDKETAFILTTHGKGIKDIHEKLARLTVTSGCGQGTIFSCTLDKILEMRLPKATVLQSTLYALLKQVPRFDKIYRQAGSVRMVAASAERTR